MALQMFHTDTPDLLIHPRTPEGERSRIRAAEPRREGNASISEQKEQPGMGQAGYSAL